MDMGLWGMPGTMGMSFGSFLVMWTLMMAAMMLSSMAPLALLYSRTITTHRGPRLTAFGSGYIMAWGATGVAAFIAAEFFAENQNIAGFDNPGKSLFTTIRELTENSLDAAESINVLPNISITVEQISQEDLNKQQGLGVHERVDEKLYKKADSPKKKLSKAA
ncbi:MAG: hypothetical protein HOH27_09090, partial [Acidimicrobiaceae bacterium]|nr:hypothetical protein [Acidimicrobiaceae bacterium]